MESLKMHIKVNEDKIRQSKIMSLTSYSTQSGKLSVEREAESDSETVVLSGGLIMSFYDDHENNDGCQREEDKEDDQVVPGRQRIGTCGRQKRRPDCALLSEGITCGRQRRRSGCALLFCKICNKYSMATQFGTFEK
ncbi:hypothetical protein CDAR_410081 [Caerostris darwini]|uniref:Uncharacterized protein n=1 Tax=Caerostris darwini TaxID=1538125 RepID=A0AAV4VW94_9ARAC|nr:hypothetical protein CDAR_410081 [Caerostris darwini]